MSADTNNGTAGDAARIRVGVLLPTREQAITTGPDVPALLEFAALAEQLGFDSLWTGDSLTARSRLDPFIVLAAVAARTSHIGLGTAALTAALRHPLVSSALISSLDHAAGRRLTLALGSGFPIPETEQEFAATGASFTGRAGRLDDIVDFWRTAWNAAGSTEPSSYRGRYLEADDLERLSPPARPDGPPLWLAGSNTPAVLRRVARRYDGWLPFLPSAEAYKVAWEQIRELSLEAGRKADAVVPGFYATVHIDPDETAARTAMEHYVRGYYRNSLEAMAEIQAYVWGSAAKCAEWLQSYAEAGMRHVVIRVGSTTPLKYLEQIADTLLPALR